VGVDHDAVKPHFDHVDCHRWAKSTSEADVSGRVRRRAAREYLRSRPGRWHGRVADGEVEVDPTRELAIEDYVNAQMPARIAGVVLAKKEPAICAARDGQCSSSAARRGN
jgi:hypothetical protein